MPGIRRGSTLLGWVTGIATALGGVVLLLLPARLALRGYRVVTWDGAVAADGIGTLDDAVAACRRSGLQGWELVTFAQQTVHRRFSYYSCRNLWDSPAEAFRRGMGYCTQYNLALKRILERLGFSPRGVFSLKVRVADDPDWAMGHTWLKVSIGGEVRDVCAGHADNQPGRVAFVPVAPTLPGNPFVFTLTHLGMILFCGILEWRALLTQTPVPSWMLQPRLPSTDSRWRALL